MEPDRTRLYLTRHGEVVNHGVYNGQNDVDITPGGVRQMEKLRELMREKRLRAVYCSDLIRTRRGAEIIAQPHGLAPRAFPEFREMNFGRWQGLSYTQVNERYPGDIPEWFRDIEGFRVPEGESMREVHQRAVPKLRELIERHRGEEFAIICHGALNRVILADALHLPMADLLRIEQDYGCLNIIDYTPSWTVVKLVNG